MPPAATKPPTQRKRNRKRKRQAVSSSSSSDSSDEETPTTTAKIAEPTTKSLPKPSPSSSSSSSSSSSDSSESSSSAEEGLEEAAKVNSSRGRQSALRQFSPSPSPPPAAIPSFLPPKSGMEPSAVQEQQLKDKFRQFWMSAIVDGFKDDLEEIRKEPNLGPSRLALLIDSLAAGAEVFSSNDDTTINEMDVVLN